MTNHLVTADGTLITDQNPGFSLIESQHRLMADFMVSKSTPAIFSTVMSVCIYQTAKNERYTKAMIGLWTDVLGVIVQSLSFVYLQCQCSVVGLAHYTVILYVYMLLVFTKHSALTDQ